MFTRVSRQLGAQAGEAGSVGLHQCLDGQKQDVMATGQTQRPFFLFDV